MKTRLFNTGFLFIILLLLITTPLIASDNKTDQKPPKKTEDPKEIFSTTHHAIKIGMKKLKYTATAGQLILRDDDSGEQKAKLFFIAYETMDKDTHARPITFAFNGGPGSSSVWLHLGAIGPKRVILNKNGAALPPPATLTDNEFSWLAFTDVVFIDPVGTGYSRALDEKKGKQFYGFKKDIESVGDFIRLYLTRYNRWLSPKFVVGESYGTTRAVGLTEYLHKTYGIDFNGVVLISPVLDFNTILFSPSNNLPYFLFLPTYTATALYHNKLSKNASKMETVLDEVETWVLDEYITCLARGNALSSSRREAVAEKMAGYTGISQSYILNNNLKISDSRFRKELLRNEQRIIGRMDTRFTGPDTDATAQESSYDPSLEMLIGAFSSAINHYVRNDLKFKNDTPYRYLNYNVSRAWDWQSGIRHGQGYVNVSRILTDAVHTNRHLRVFIAAGYYDLATPYFAVKYTINQLELDKSLKSNIAMHFYNAGHMMYINKPTLKNLSTDMASFYNK